MTRGVSTGSIRAVLGVLVGPALLVTGCGGGSGGTAPGSTSVLSSTPGSQSGTAGGGLEVLHLPRVAPPRLAYLADGVLSLDGRVVRTGIPRGAVSPRLLGKVGGSILVGVYADAGERLYSVDPSGRSTVLGHAPGGWTLIPDAGRVWAAYSDRGTGRRSTTVVDAHTGRVVARFDGADPPSSLDLSAGEEALLARWNDPGPSGSNPASPDGTLAVQITNVRHGELVDIRHRSDSIDAAAHGLVRRLRFTRLQGKPQPGLVVHDDPAAVSAQFEDDGHVLIVFTVPGTRHALEEVVVRCDLTGHCGRATGLVHNLALGLTPDSLVGS